MMATPQVLGRRGTAAVVLGLLAAGFLALAGCSGRGRVPSAIQPGSGCGRRAAVGSTTLHLNVDGHDRVVIVHVPNGYQPTAQTSLVLNLHGTESTARQQELFSGMDTTADRDAFLVAYPQALIEAGSGFDWNIPGVPLLGGSLPPAGAASDVRFVIDLIHMLSATYCIDDKRVFATGISGGGRMASQLACDASATIAAVAPVAGLRFPTPCPSARAVPVMAFHGTADRIDPYAGNGQAYWTYSVPTAATRWAAHDGCAPRPHVRNGSGFTLTTYSGCATSAGVTLYTLAGEGHEWPGGPTMPISIRTLLGPQTRAVDANTVMWAFFEKAGANGG